MSSTVETVLKGIRFAAEAYNVYESVGNSQTDLAKADLAAKSALLMLHSIGALSSGTVKPDLERERRFVTTESGLRFLHTMTVGNGKFAQEMEQARDGLERMKGLEEIFANMFSGVRSAVDISKLSEQIYLSMDPEEFAKTERPIYDADGDIIGSKPLDAEECQKNIEFCRTSGNVVTVLEIIARLKLVTRTIEFFTGQGPVRAPERFQALAQGVPQNIAQALNLSAYGRIPPELREDPVLSLYVCPLTHEPIRYIVRDPRNEDHYYERRAILQHVRENPVSPLIPGLELREDMLEECPDLQGVIDNRLAALTGRIRDALENAIHEEAVEGVEGPELIEAAEEDVVEDFEVVDQDNQAANQ